MMAALEIPKLHTLEQVAEMLPSISLRKLKDGCRTLKYEHVRIGRSRLMTAEQVAQLITESTARKTEPAVDADLAADQRRAARAMARGPAPRQRRSAA